MSAQVMHTCGKCGILFSEETLTKKQRTKRDFELCHVCYREKKKPRVVCVYCGHFCFATRDHLIPHCRERQLLWDERDRILLPACRRCNTDKGSKTLREWLESLNQEDGVRRQRIASLVANPSLAWYV